MANPIINPSGVLIDIELPPCDTQEPSHRVAPVNAYILRHANLTDLKHKYNFPRYLTPRAGIFNKKGKEINVSVNQYMVKKWPQKIFYQYDVSSAPVRSPKPILTGLLRLPSSVRSKTQLGVVSARQCGTPSRFRNTSRTPETRTHFGGMAIRLLGKLVNCGFQLLLTYEQVCPRYA